MRETEFATFFGDGEKRFCLTPDMILELEKATGHGIGAIFARVQTNMFSFTEMVETIRLALIGGGESPSRAFELVDRYAKTRPIGEVLPVVAEILAILWIGRPPASVDPTQEVAVND